MCRWILLWSGVLAHLIGMSFWLVLELGKPGCWVPIDITRKEPQEISELAQVMESELE